MEMHIFYKPLETVGGDFYYYRIFPEQQKMLLFIGDITGHGISSAILVGMVVTAARILGTSEDTPKVILEKMHEAVLPLFEKGYSAEMLCAIFDFREKKMSISQAGVVPVIFFHSQEKKYEMIQKPGTRIGFAKKFFCNQVDIPFQENDIVLIATDGIAEAEVNSEERYGMDKLGMLVSKACEESCQDIAQKIYDNTCSMAKIVDDVTIVAIKIGRGC